ncbi:MAG: AbrB/MazE/SpoVT family DNA-binding domain-containing protein [Methanomassiliicoccaceae archaeon]|nr:AbrB/MazE/SpoVT family DNA-binding domain-containing protein [Methanomassiliicoccaceae archaeon]
MDVRRVQITGGSSFMITLPKDWANSVGLKKNDTVGIKVQSDGALSLYPKGVFPTPKRSTKIIDATNIKDHDFFFRQLVGAYIAGHTTILIKSSRPMTSEITSTVTHFVQTSIGLEMIEADESQILVANLIEHDAIDTKKIIERMGMLVKNMIWDLYGAASTGNLKSISDMASRDTEIDRIYWLTSRQYNIYQKDVVVQYKNGLPLYEMTACLFLSRILEGVGDHAVAMSIFLASMGELKADKGVYELGEKVTTLLMNSVKSWTTRDLALAEQCLKEANEISRRMDKASSVNKPVEDERLLSTREAMLFSTRRMSDYCKSIAEFAFNMAME